MNPSIGAGNAASLNQTECEPARQPQTHAAMNSMNGAIDDAERVICGLVERLNVVLRPCPPTPCPDKANTAREVKAPFAEGIDHSTARLRELSERLMDVMQRLEV